MLALYLSDVYANNNPIVTRQYITTQIYAKLFAQDSSKYNTETYNIIKDYFSSDVIVSGPTAANSFLKNKMYGPPEITVLIKPREIHNREMDLPLEKLKENLKTNLTLPKLNFDLLYPKAFKNDKYTGKFIFSPKIFACGYGIGNKLQWKDKLHVRSDRDSNTSNLFTVIIECIWKLDPGTYVTNKLKNKTISGYTLNIPILYIKLSSSPHKYVEGPVNFIQKDEILKDLIWKCICSFINDVEIYNAWKTLKIFYTKYKNDIDDVKRFPKHEMSLKKDLIKPLSYMGKYKDTKRKPLTEYNELKKKTYVYSIGDMITIPEWEPPSFNLKFEELIQDRVKNAFACIDYILFDPTPLSADVVDIKDITRQFDLSGYDLENIQNKLEDYSILFKLVKGNVKSALEYSESEEVTTPLAIEDTPPAKRSLMSRSLMSRSG